MIKSQPFQRERFVLGTVGEAFKKVYTSDSNAKYSITSEIGTYHRIYIQEKIDYLLISIIKVGISEKYER